MSSIRLSALLVIAGLLVACATPRENAVVDGAEPGKAPPYTLERFRGEAKVAEGVQAFSFDNPYGEIQVRQTTASAVAWQGVEQRIGEKPRIAQVLPFHEGDRQGVRIRYPGVDPGKPANLRLGRVDLYVFVPVGYLVDLKTDGAGINVRRIKDDVRARSRGGPITIANRGAVDAHSESGEIRAFTMQGLGDRPTRLHTGGNIIVDVPVFDDVALTAWSAGELQSEFTLDDRSTDGRGHTQARWKHGKGSKTMDLHAGGSIVLQRLDAPLR